MEWLSVVCDGIVLAAAVMVAIKTIADMFGKPIRLVRNRVDEDFKNRVVEILNEVLPAILYQHDLEVRDKYRADRQKYLTEIKDEVVRTISNKLNQVDVLGKQYSALEISAKDVLREKIVCMYETNKDKRKLKFFERAALTQYYRDYKAMGGNSYIDKLYGRMDTWEVEPDDYE